MPEPTPAAALRGTEERDREPRTNVSERSPAERTERAGDTRGRILQAATAQFAAKGLAGARVDEIARTASVNKQLVYYYFGGKLELYNEVLGQLVEESRHKIAGEAAAGSAAEKLGLLTRIGTHPNSMLWQRLLSWEALETDPHDGIVREDERRSAWERHVDTIRAAQEAGELDPELAPELIAVALVSMAIFPFVLPQVVKFMTGHLPTDDAFLSQYPSVVEDLILRLAPRTSHLSG
jgi:TetR/AcrR family transcriptional regulator